MGKVGAAMWVGIAFGSYTRNLTDYAVYWKHTQHLVTFMNYKGKKLQPINYVTDLHKLNVSWFMAATAWLTVWTSWSSWSQLDLSWLCCHFDGSPLWLSDWQLYSLHSQFNLCTAAELNNKPIRRPVVNTTRSGKTVIMSLRRVCDGTGAYKGV